MSAPLAVFDIGSSLVDGPAYGPASRIAETVGLDVALIPTLHRLLMTVDHAGPAQVCVTIREQLGLSDPSIEVAVTSVWNAQENEAKPIPGAFETLRAFAAQGYRLALLSNIWTPYLRSVRRLLGDFFDTHIPPELQLLSCCEGLAKPAPELFHRVLERAAADPADTLMVGDSYTNDIEPAISCGMRTLWLLHDPVRETPALIRVLNSTATAPTLTSRSLADVDFRRLGWPSRSRL